MAKITISDVNKKYAKIIGFLLVSGILGLISSKYIAGNESLTVMFAPAINFILYIIYNELKNQGYREALK